MTQTTVALLHPGDMGSAVGADLVAVGVRVLWASEARSAATRARALTDGLEDRLTLPTCLDASSVVLSICPPHAAVDLAREVAGHAFRGLYIDANAISPDAAREAAALIERAGGHFVDGGIVGPPPRVAGKTRLFLSGAAAAQAAALFGGTRIEAIALPGEIGAASGLKACYAAWTKGSIALLSAIRALARHEGVEDALLTEWARSQPDLAQRSATVTMQARKAWRWVGEMHEIAASFEGAGLPGGFHRAAGEIYEELELFKDASTPPSLDQVLDALAKNRH